MRFVFSFVVPSRSLNPPMVECYVTIESCLRHIRVSTQGTNECVHCTVMLFLVSHQFNYSPPHIPRKSGIFEQRLRSSSLLFSPRNIGYVLPPIYVSLLVHNMERRSFGSLPPSFFRAFQRWSISEVQSDPKFPDVFCFWKSNERGGFFKKKL